MNVNDPKFVEAARERKATRRAKHKERIKAKNKRRGLDYQNRLMYWVEFDALNNAEAFK